MTPQIKGALLLGAAMFLFSAMSALVKIAGDAVPAAEAVFFRGLVGCAVLLVIARRQKVSLRGHRKGLLLARGLAGSIALLMVFYAFARIPVANALLLNQATPVFMVPLAVFFLKERISRTHIALMGLALGGVLLVIRPDVDGFSAPGLLALGSAFFAAIAYILVRKLNETEHITTIVFWFTVISTVTMMPLMIGNFVVPDLRLGLLLLGIGLAGTGGQLLLTRAYRHGEAGRLAILGSTGAVFGVLWDFFLWQHVPDLLTGVGGLVVIVACGWIQLIRHGRHKPKSANSD